MNRQSRLQSAKQWILTYAGKNIIKGYRKWFGVNLQCAIQYGITREEYQEYTQYGDSLS